MISSPSIKNPNLHWRNWKSGNRSGFANQRREPNMCFSTFLSDSISSAQFSVTRTKSFWTSAWVVWRWTQCLNQETNWSSELLSAKYWWRTSLSSLSSRRWEKMMEIPPAILNDFLAGSISGGGRCPGVEDNHQFKGKSTNFRILRCQHRPLPHLSPSQSYSPAPGLTFYWSEFRMIILIMRFLS